MIRIGFLAMVSILMGANACAQTWHGEVGDVPDLKKAAAGGDAEAIAELAWYRYYSLGGLRFDPIEVPAAFLRAAEKGSVLGKAGVAMTTWHGTRWTEEKEKGWPYAKAAWEAAPDNTLYKAIAALFYQYGHGPDKDEDLAGRLFLEAWEAGEPFAGERLAHSYRHGSVPFERDMEKFAELARELATKYQFIGPASVLLDYVERGRVEESVAMTRQLRLIISDGARRGDPEAQFRMAWIHRKDGDWETALRFYELAARNDHPIACSNLLNRFVLRPDDPNMLRVESETLNRLARRNYEMGGPDFGVRELAGRAYRDGQGGRHNYARAEGIFREQLDQGRCSMHNELGYLYCVERDSKPKELHRVELGMAHLLAHAHHGPGAASFLGGVHAGDFTDDVPTDLPKAYAAASRARESWRGYWSERRFSNLVKRMSEAQIAEGKALMEDGYPHELKHRQAAIDVLVKEGQWEEGRELR